MSEIQRHEPKALLGSDAFMNPKPDGRYILFTDHEAAIARLEIGRSRAYDESQHYSDRLDEAGDHIKAHLTRIAELEAAIEKLNVEIAGKGREIARLDAALAEKQQVLADAKARIEGLKRDRMELSDKRVYDRAIDDCLAALTQPQTERCPEDCDGFGRLIGDSDGPCPACSGLESDGGGAATAAGVADADLVRVGDFFGIPAFTHPDVKPGIVGIVSAGEVTAVIADREEPGPYAKAFRERVCPVPEFPGIKNRQEDQA